MTTPEFDLANREDRNKLSKRLLADIDTYCRTAFNDGHRTHLGASLINRECSRYLWYVFRWVYNKEFDGRMQRLFQRGHREEEFMLKMLEGIGCNVSPVDYEAPNVLHYNTVTGLYHYETTFKGDGKVIVEANTEHGVTEAESQGVYPDYPQHRVSGCEGHFGGSIDNLLELPKQYNLFVMFINEFKTQATGAKFTALMRDGVQKEKPDHYTQMCIYGWKKGHKYGVYMAANKNDDSLHVEVVELDWELAQRMEAKAHRIIFSRTPPQKLSESLAHSTCQYCDMKEVCHQAKPYEKNCRSCAHAQAIPGKQWGCNLHGQVIPATFIPTGCNSWTPAV